jgi:site-specific recombinase XerD
MRTVRQFFERIIEWDWPGAPARNPVIAWDIPKKPEPLPKFLDDRDAARLMAAARASSDPRDRLVVELLARTGMRAGELADLEADAVVQIGAGHWLRIPLGKLRNDRYVPLHPELVTLLAAWTADSLQHIRRHKRLVADHRGPLDRYVIGRIVARVGRAAGVPGVHPHRLRHTLATQAINRGMRLGAIAALLGHRKMEMTLIYARIANRVVADEYAAVSASIDALYGQPPELPPTTRPPPWPGCAAKHTPACSATACAPARPSSTAGWNQPAKPAPTSAPVPNSCPSWSASATTPATTIKPTGPRYSTGSSSAPTPPRNH